MALIKSYLRDTSSYMRVPLEPLNHPPTDPLLEPGVTTAIRDTPSCCHTLIHIISRQKEAIICLHYQTGADSHNRWCDTVQFEDAWFCIQSSSGSWGSRVTVAINSLIRGSQTRRRAEFQSPCMRDGGFYGGAVEGPAEAILPAAAPKEGADAQDDGRQGAERLLYLLDIFSTL